MKPNRIKARLQAGRVALGVSMMIPSPQLVEMIGLLGFDWVLIDCEHGAMDWESVELMAMAAELHGLTPIVRPPNSSPDAILRALDRGAMGIQAPHICTAADARRVVESVKYHPLGRRGLAAGTRPADYGLGISAAEYAAQANHETLVCVQIEDAEALPHLSEMLQVADIDVFFVGPADLSQSLGYPGQTNAPPVHAAINQTLDAILSAGKTAGITGGSNDLAEWVRRGCRYVYTHIPRLLAVGAAELQDTLKPL